MGILDKFIKQSVEVNVEYADTIPSMFRLVSAAGDIPPLSYTLLYDDDSTYNSNYDRLVSMLLDWMKNEETIIARLNYEEVSPFIYLFKNSNIVSLPSYLDRLDSAFSETVYNTFPRFMNFLSQVSMRIDPYVLNAVQGRFFWFLLESKSKLGLEWSIEDLFRLMYYHNWVYLISIYQAYTSTTQVTTKTTTIA